MIVQSNVKMYADDCKFLAVVSTREQADSIQADLDNLATWARENNSFFNEAKCVVMHHEPNNRNFDCFLNDHRLEISVRERNLGVVITSDLSSTEQVKSALLPNQERVHVHRPRHGERSLQDFRSPASRDCNRSVKSVQSREYCKARASPTQSMVMSSSHLLAATNV